VAVITAAICTRNRGALIGAAVRSALASSHPDFRVLVVDQSTNDDSQRVVAELGSDARLTYLRTGTVGVSRARNICLQTADTDFIAFTDDDCEVPPGWLATCESVLHEHPRVALAFCSVRAGPHDAESGFVPAYECNGTRVIRTLREKRTARGMGAGMAARRQLLLELRGFDEQLGPGSHFPSCEEGDLAVRALLAGYEVCETDRTWVVHHGFRLWSEGKELSRRDWYGIGAAYAKPLRAGHWGFAQVPVYELLAKAVWPPVRDLIHLRRPRGVSRAAHFVRGFAQGWTAPFDAQQLLFRGSGG
jgi:glycosyltransferase involved in cell wall biosynthesis